MEQALTLLDRGIVRRIDQVHDDVMFMIALQPTFMIALRPPAGETKFYWLPNTEAGIARRAFDSQQAIDVYGVACDPGTEKPRGMTLQWAPKESVVHRGAVVDITISSATVGVHDISLVDNQGKPGRYCQRKITNLKDALTLLGSNPEMIVEIVRVCITDKADTFQLRAEKK